LNAARPSRRARRAAAAAVAIAALSLALAAPAQQKASRASEQRRGELQTEQQRLTRELSKLKRQLAASEVSHGDAADALAASEVAISAANRRLRELSEARALVEQQLDALRARRRQVAGHQNRAEQRLADIARRQHALSLDDPLIRFLAGEAPAERARESEYLAYLGRATAAAIGELQQRRTELEELEARSSVKRDELAKIAEEEKSQRAQLLSDQAQQKRTLDKLGRQIAQQRQSIAKVERDEQRLSALVRELARVMAEQTRRAAEREAQARRQAQAKPPAAKSAEPPPAASVPQPAPGSGFAQRRGMLPLPAHGVIAAHFGSPRKVEGGGTAPTWKGVFIRAPHGSEVRAVAPGQVVFADWLRGFGNLLVIDHGDDYMSIYGNNETLLRNIGDRVAVGDTVASVGATGGNAESGLYFELRFQGRPFDPLKWVAAR
jgi:murein hydrolase activator